MQPHTDTESETERKNDEKTPLVPNGIDDGTYVCIMCTIHRIIIYVDKVNYTVTLFRLSNSQFTE